MLATEVKVYINIGLMNKNTSKTLSFYITTADYIFAAL